MNRVIRKFSCISCAILGVAATGLIISSSTSALTEESEVDVKFTFNPMLTLSVSSADIIIPNLIPGTSDNSNTVAITVNTNNVGGYTLSATVGNTSNSSRNLVHTALNTNLFSSIDTSSNITSFTTDNTWGYSIDDGAHYSGLPIYTDTPKEIKKTTEAGNSYTNFLIGAKASSTQISGDYTNVINFTAVSNEPPIPIMQEVAEWSGNVLVGDQLIAVDARDGKEYTVARLADGNLWMTQNLDHDIVTTTDYYTNENTDIGYNSATGQYDIATWTAPAATVTSNSGSWSNSMTAPSSYDPGNVYWNGAESDGDDWAEFRSSCNFMTLVCDETKNPSSKYVSSSGNIHYHMGNFYNWTAAIAMTDSSGISQAGSIVERSICPAGWTLPRTGVGEDSFYRLNNAYGITAFSVTASNNPINSPLYFGLGGLYVGFYGGIGLGGGWWSPVVINQSRAGWYGDYGSDSDYDIRSDGEDSRLYGMTIRCIARPVSTTYSSN